MTSTLTTGQFLRDLPPGVFKTLQKIRPTGALQARCKANGSIFFYWRYSLGNKSERVSIGAYDSTSSPKSLLPSVKGYSIAAAVRAAEELAVNHHANKDTGGHPALEAAKRLAKIEEQAHKERALKCTLKNLLLHYCAHLKALGRKSHLEAQSVFKCHVFESWPALANLPANQVECDQFTDMMRKVVNDGKGRTSNKLRSYLRAAYQTAKTANSRGATPTHFKDYKININPINDTFADSRFNGAAKKPLSIQELRTYWKNIKPLPGIKGGVLKLHLLTGGQRIEQLVRLKTDDDLGSEIRIFDTKGRPGTGSRTHIVPLVNEAVNALSQCNPQNEFALSTDEGETHIAGTTLSGWAREHASDIAGFSAKRIRSGVETALARAGVGRETRGHLQSHGISGVQSKHYDDYDYLKEKRDALSVLLCLLEQPSNVIFEKFRISI